jgi:glucose/arabinose dehydrogenase
MAVRTRIRASLVAAATALGVLLGTPGAVAHPPDNPFDDTIFAPIQPGGFEVRLVATATGLTAPNKGVVAPGDPSTLYVVDQPGKLWAVDLASGRKTAVLDVGSRLVTLGVFGPGTFDERGFLGVAFHPGFARNGLLYTYTSEPVSAPPTFPSTLPAGVAPDHQNVVAEWRVKKPGKARSAVDPQSRRELLRVDWPQFNHDGGDLAFGPDGLLYTSMGDGGEADDQGVGHLEGGNAQRLDNPLGKIHRIDVDRRNSANGQYGIPADNPFVSTPGALAEIFAFGFRNPFRFSFDRATGKLYASDAGQNDIEEIDVVVKGGNYGWRRKEGTLFFCHNGAADGFATDVAPCEPVPPDAIDPIAQYDTHHEGHSAIGGFVYRGTAFEQLAGRYVFGDFARVFRFPSGPNDSGRLFWLAQKEPGTNLAQIQELYARNPASPGQQEKEGTEGIGLALLGFGQDASGELYALGNISGTPFGTEGVVLKIVPKP